MKGRVNFDGEYTSMSVDWAKLVETPLKNGYIIEAFSSADALIDSQLQSILRQIFNSFESQDLINYLESTREESKFFGSGVLEILEKLNVIDKKELGDKIRYFKGKRNIVSHTIYGGYSLLRSSPFKNQQEFDLAIEKEAKKILSQALDIFKKLVNIIKKLCNKFKGMDEKAKCNWLIKKKNET